MTLDGAAETDSTQIIREFWAVTDDSLDRCQCRHKMLLQEDLQDNARAMTNTRFYRIASDWIIQGAAYAIFKRWRGGDIIDSQPKIIIEVLPEHFATLLTSVDVATWAFGIALETTHPVYDSHHLACTELFPLAFRTNKRNLCQVVRNTSYQALVRRLDDPGLPEALEP